MIPVLVELNGKVREWGECLIREGHISIDHTATATECTGDLQTLPPVGWKPHLQGRSQHQ